MIKRQLFCGKKLSGNFSIVPWNHEVAESVPLEVAELAILRRMIYTVLFGFE